MEPRPAPEWIASEWLNSERPLTLADLRGRVVVLYAFQMLCPGCAAQALPQAKRVHDAFRETDVAVVGLHTVFEHHEANSAAALKAFLGEYRLTFPVGIDEPGAGTPLPRTMSAYAMQGTHPDPDRSPRAPEKADLRPRPGPSTGGRDHEPGD